MASAYLGPETHRPLAVISESYQHRYNLPTLEEHDKYRFGPDYEEKFFSLVHEHLELGTTDRLAYVGDIRGSLSEAIKERFCLVHPVQTVIPGHFHYAETDSRKMVPIQIAHVGAEEYFRNLASEESEDKTKFDRILVKDSIRYLADPRTTYKNMADCLHHKEGKMLLVHRPSELNTLPYSSDARHRLSQSDVTYMNIIKDLQACRLDVTWQLESLPVRMRKDKWLSMVREKFPPQMEILSQLEVMSGIRELTEGILKYEGEMVEFMDRLLFISVSPSPLRPSTTLPSVKRQGQSSDRPAFPSDTPLRYVMKMCPDQLKELKKKERQSREDDE